MSTHRGQLHGMVWESEIDLHLPSPPAGMPVDFRLHIGSSREISEDAPPGHRLAHLTDPATHRPMYTLVRQSEQILLRFHRLAEFSVSTDLREGTFHPGRGTDVGFASVLAVGMLASTLLMLRGQPVLHGSAVEDDGAALALVGASGMGKSTLSTLLCQTGSALITDDVLVVQPSIHGPVCRAGAGESRLRPGAKYLLNGDPSTTRDTADGRLAFSPDRRGRDVLPLKAIGTPYPTRGCTAFSVERLSKAAAMIELLRFPRIVGWQDPETLAEHFAFLGALVDQVPVVRLRIPWSDRLEVATASELREALHAL